MDTAMILATTAAKKPTDRPTPSELDDFYDAHGNEAAKLVRLAGWAARIFRRRDKTGLVASYHAEA